MGGLARALPWTAGTMLMGVIAITGLAVPLSEQVLGEAIAFSGYHSKDAILAAALAFVELNPQHTLVFALPALGAGLTSFYMFRLWLAVFAGSARPEQSEIREPGWLMRGPLLVLAVCAMFAGVGGEHGPLATWLGHSAPVMIQPDQVVSSAISVTYPDHEAIDAVHGRAAAFGLTAAIAGAVLAWATHRLRQPAQEASVDWTGRIPSPALFDEVYAQIVVAPVFQMATLAVRIDERYLNGLLHRLAAGSNLWMAWCGWWGGCRQPPGGRCGTCRRDSYGTTWRLWWRARRSWGYWAFWPSGSRAVGPLQSGGNKAAS